MAIPKSKRHTLVVYLREEKEHIAALREALEQAAKDLQTAIAGSTVGTITNVQARAQLAAVLQYQQQLAWKLETIIANGQRKAAQAASRVVSEYEDELFGNLMNGPAMRALADAEAYRAAQGVQAAISRLDSSALPLSKQVYRTEALANKWVEKLVNQALVQGWDAKKLAKEIYKFISPSVPGGQSYAAMRLARTEINNAFHATTIRRYQDDKIVEMVEWNLSSSHPEGDECDGLASDGPYPVKSVPKKPHPQCFCFVTPVLPDREEFVKKLFNGDYGDTPWAASVDPAMASNFTDETLAPKLKKLPKIPPSTSYQQMKLASATTGGLSGAVNPGKKFFGTIDYGINCSRVVHAMELRLRGYNVIAAPKARNIHDNGLSNIATMFRTATGGHVKFDMFKGRKAIKAGIEDSDPGRYFVVGTWTGGKSSHIFNMQKNDDGSFEFFEGQSAISDASKYLDEMSPTKEYYLLRVDDKVYTNGILDGTPGVNLPWVEVKKWL